MTITKTILDLENWSARGATAELARKCLTVRLSFRLNNAPAVRSLASAGQGIERSMIPNLLAVEYSKTSNDSIKGKWVITLLRVYGYMEGKPENNALNVYPHDNLESRLIPAWIRDAAISVMPE